ncbi:site-2 protease family protein [Blastococcus jejuensis]|uniref:Zinc metalloprotease n=1 Tax=Blastococcus jejuensis TaxID=351224 RepID=A0ABP6NZ76_9ACTN
MADRAGAGRPAGADTAGRGTFPVGRIAGVRVAVHWSVLAIVGLIAWALSAEVLPAADPGEPAWVYVVTGACTAIAFVLGLLAHEVSHAVVARHHGVAVEGITLWLFGGVARLRGEAPTARADLRIAGVGPLVSLLLGVACYLVAVGAAALGLSGPPLAALGWLAAMNVLLAVFNVLPGAPLDGGRLLRAALWMWRGDRVWAAVTAARAGRVLGLVLVALGVAQFLATGLFSGLWLAMIGWFVMGAAGAEEMQAQVGGLLADLRVAAVMTPRPDVVPAGLTVAAFVDEYLFSRRHSSFPVVDDGRPVGLLTLARVKAVPAADRATTPLRDIAWPLAEIAVAAPDDRVPDLVARLGPAGDGRALVLADGELVGIVTPTDISRAVQHAALRGPDRRTEHPTSTGPT